MQASSFLNKFYIILLLFCCLPLSACSTVRSSVQIFHQKNLHLKGKTYAFSPIKKFNQEDDLNFDYYSKFIAGYLNEYGMHQSEIKQAQIVVKYSYYIKKPGEQVSSRRLFGKKVKRGALYPYHFLIKLYYKKDLLYGEKQPIYQVTVIAVRKKRQPMMQILPYMIKAAFYDFPGDNGSVRSIKTSLRHKHYQNKTKLDFEVEN